MRSSRRSICYDLRNGAESTCTMMNSVHLELTLPWALFCELCLLIFVVLPGACRMIEAATWGKICCKRSYGCCAAFYRNAHQVWKIERIRLSVYRVLHVWQWYGTECHSQLVLAPPGINFDCDSKWCSVRTKAIGFDAKQVFKWGEQTADKL